MMNEWTMLSAMVFLFISTLLFILAFGRTVFARNLRIFIFMVVRVISEKIKEMRRRADHRPPF